MKLSPTQISLVLKRAAEIDASGDSLTVEELERIAAEAGIDPRATRTAIAEFVAEESSSPVAGSRPESVTPIRARGPTYPSGGRIVAGGAVGLVCGLLSALSEAGAIAGIGVTGIYVILRALQAMRRGSQIDFQLQTFALWFGWLLFMLAGYGEAGVLVVWYGYLITSVLGGLLIRFGPREDGATDEDVPRIRS